MQHESPLEESQALSRALGVTMLLKRDDLLPFPLAGNKFRKLSAEVHGAVRPGDIVISNGGIDSNHCRTLAMLGAIQGFTPHLVLHGEGTTQSTRALRVLERLGATYDIVDAPRIGPRVQELTAQLEAQGRRVAVIAGGCHTPRGAVSYRDAAVAVLREAHPDYVIFASGTGATHGGIAAAAHQVGTRVQVVGISVARTAERGIAAVREAAGWAGAPDADICFLDSYRDGGYGMATTTTLEAVHFGWRHGVPLDPTYTGKAFAGLLGLLADGTIEAGARVLFWHTGGLWNALEQIEER